MNLALIRSFVHSEISQNPFITFFWNFAVSYNSERRKKCSKRFFEKKSCFAHFCQKLSKIGHFWPKCPKMEVFRIFLGIRSLLFSETLQLIRAFNWLKNVPSAFLKKNPVSPILAKNCPKLVIFDQNAQKWRFFAFFSESLHYFFLKLCS